MSAKLVYVVWWGLDIEDADVDIIFERKEDAEAYIAQHPNLHLYMREPEGTELWDEVPPVE